MENNHIINAIHNVSKCRKSIVFLYLVAFFFLAVPLTVQANTKESDSDWQFAAELYLWYASIGGSTATGGDLDIDASNLLDDLNIAFMGNIAARKNRWGVMLDTLYLNASDDQDTLVGPVGVNVEVELDGWVVTPMVGYELVSSDLFLLNAVAGARYLSLGTDVDLRTAGSSAIPFNTSLSESGNNWDGIIGIRGEVLLNSKWFIPFHLDIGTGDSDYTWQAFAGLGYRFNRLDILAGYRYLYWEFEDNAALDDLELSGFGAGIRFYF